MKPETFDRKWLAAMQNFDSVKMIRLLRKQGFVADVAYNRTDHGFTVITSGDCSQLPSIVGETAYILICCGLIARSRHSKIIDVPAFGLFKSRFTCPVALPLDKLPRPKPIVKRARARK